MNFKFWEWGTPEKETTDNDSTEIIEDSNQGYWDGSNYFDPGNIISFDGEKTPYELGEPVEIDLDYWSLRARSWEKYVTSDLIQNAIRKYLLWIIGSGLKIQSNPVDIILKNKGVNLSKEQRNEFIENVESQFRLFADSRISVHSEQMNLHKLCIEAMKNALLSGDVLIVQRFKNGIPTTQIIDGAFIEDPLDESLTKNAERRGNIIMKGVEVDKKGKHVAFYVRNEDGMHSRVLARGEKTKKLQAWLMYGLRHKISDVRGMTLLVAVMETASKIDRYKDASLGNAEENNKIPYQITHDQFSDGENPIVKELQQSMGRNKGTAPETESYDQCKQVASKVALSTSKKVYNMPIGSKLERNEFKSDAEFESFYNINVEVVYTTLGIPPEVARDLYQGSYSSSRAALKSWEYKMKVDRKNSVSDEFYGPIFDYWLDINILQQNINAPGYLKLVQEKDFMGVLAYRNKRFIGVSVPHIDPVKEVKAIREKLGGEFKDVPLMSADQATEELSTGDFNTIIKKAENEKDIASEFIDNDPEPKPTGSGTD